MSEQANITTSGDGEAVKDEPTTVDPAMEQGKNSSEELNTLKASLDTMEERLQQQSALIGKLNNSLKKESKAEPEKKAEEPKGEVEQYNEMKQQLDTLQARMKKQDEAAKLSAIELALVEAGADPKRAKDQSDFFAFKLGERVVTSDDSAGNISIQIADTDGSNVAVNDWAKALLQRDEGAYLRAGKTGPSIKNGGNAREDVGKSKVSSLDFSKGVAEAVRQGPKALEQYRATHAIRE